MSIAKPATAPVASGTLTSRSIRRSPRMIAGCIVRIDLARLQRGLGERAGAPSRPGASISSISRAMTSAASRAFDRLDERPVDEAEPQVRPAVPHRETAPPRSAG